MQNQVNGKTVFVPCPDCKGRGVKVHKGVEHVCQTCGDSGYVPERTAFEFMHEVDKVAERSLN